MTDQPDPDRRRHALAFNALGTALNASGHWLPFTARQTAVDAVLAAIGQQPEATSCGSRSLPTYSGEVVRCVLHVGHAKQCQSAAEHPYVSWPNPSNGEGWRTVGQPAEAHTAEGHPPRVRWRLEVWKDDRWTQPRPYPHDTVSIADVHRKAWLQNRPDARTRIVRETTTWTVEDETR
ncbi:hypothetical protein ACFW96_09225 [Streptomyces gardneri]|uniref:hypothetical protein n=1 Tax=Streptomyces gardneri TaxID=66892 RepID=UPI0036C16D1C